MSEDKLVVNRIELKHDFAVIWIISSGLVLSIYGFIQDFMGKEEYLKFIDKQWINFPYWIWFILIIFNINKFVDIYHKYGFGK